MRIFIICIIALCCTFLSSNPVHAVGMVKVTIKVIDEEDKSVEGAQVRLRLQGGTLKKDMIVGTTDQEGAFTQSGFSSDGSVGGGVEKNGYYMTSFHTDFITTTLGMYQPWNKEVKVVLRPKLKPVPMYVRNKMVKIPVVGREVGFDLIKFDWVAPYGLGTVADFVFYLESYFDQVTDRDHSNLQLTFSNKFDGIQPFELDMGGDFGVGSQFRTLRYAPESGYRDKLQTRYDPYAPGSHAYRTTDDYYFFRVRSEVDDKGNLKRAMYGKLKGNLKAKPKRDGLAEIELLYWLNPDYTTNMEFDIDSNLFRPLPEREIIRIP